MVWGDRGRIVKWRLGAIAAECGVLVEGDKLFIHFQLAFIIHMHN